MPSLNEGASSAISVKIGGLPIEIQSNDCDFITMLENRYAGFVERPVGAAIRLNVDIVPAGPIASDEDLHVRHEAGRWTMHRGDFRAEWDPTSRCGRVRQAAFPYAIDSVMRILHSLVLAEQGGFLLHSASAVRAGRAFLFSGVSGAGKSTIARLAPPDVTLLTDEISYIRPVGDDYRAYGTPFAGELEKPGANIAAPVAALYLLKQGPRNDAVRLATSDAARRLLRNILFFADDDSLVQHLFHSACRFVSRVPVYELTFRPDGEVWKLIG